MRTIQQSCGFGPGRPRDPIYVRGPLDGQTAYGPRSRFRDPEGQALIRSHGEKLKRAGTGVYRLIRAGDEFRYVYLTEEGKSE